MTAKMSMEEIKSRGNFVQLANVEAEQTMKKIDAAGDVKQIIHIDKQNAEELADQIQQLRIKLEEYAPSARADIDILNASEKSARDKDGASLLSLLKGLSRMAIDVAKDVGSPIIKYLMEKMIKSTIADS